MLPFSESCERNKEPILRVLRAALGGCRRVLEIGSGTGQHAVHFGAHLPHLEWQPTELAHALPPLAARIALEGPPNVLAPLALDVRARPWPAGACDAVFTANTLHIMDSSCVEHFFRGVGETLIAPGVLCVYGPFRHGGRYTSASNAEFDRHLRGRDPASGIRDLEALDALALARGLVLEADHALPANNELLVWRRAP